MNRYHIYPSDKEYPEIYSNVLFFTKYFDNAEKECEAVLHAIIEAYQEKCEAFRHPISYEEAARFVQTPIRNPNHAGCKPRFTEENREEMLSLRASGKTRQQVADQFGCSLSYVEKLERKCIRGS